ncbi:hypothetical protein [Flagellimonas algicola]|uniref:TonB-dependent receptor-like protein n=1 Tax=Flagellimonas algicola TaxID=2583815 RepID=A0ABY2WJC3_9FLAO|nr:hypothetical protein [Allomuricauda algicola]TMU54943.1 hypothetical protein FGG15_12165 [Allomuricauda algicola]
MKRIRLLVVLSACIVLSQKNVCGQDSLEVSKLANAEKIYLQLNNLIHSVGQTLWFKGIVTRSADNCLSAMSQVLYVELIDFDKRVVDKKKLKLIDGIGQGSFELNPNYAPGRYLVRAYTEWNKNFGKDFVFSEYIQITTNEIIEESNKAIKNIVLTELQGDSIQLSATIQPRLIDPNFRGKLKLFIESDDIKDSVILERNRKKIYQLNYVIPKNTYQVKLKLALEGIKLRNNNIAFVNSFSRTIIVDEDKIDLQFFPEGGQIVHDIEGLVAFKAIDFNGKGVPVSGIVVNKDGEVITEFKSNDLGMGTIYLRGNVDDLYHAKVTIADKAYTYPLPKTEPQGYALKVVFTGKYARVQVKSNLTKNGSIYLNVESRGIRYRQLKLEHKNQVSKIRIPREILPDGIVKITVLDAQHIPVCERLIFNSLDRNRLTLDIQSIQKSYKQRDKVVFDIASLGKGNKPEWANTSVLVLNKGIAEQEAIRPNILSYFLLNSELNGVIENPNHYFDSKNTTRMRDLNVLMLTQGWRSYKFQSFDEAIDYKHKPEKGLQVSGTIAELLNDRRKHKKVVDLTMMAFGNPKQVFTHKVDSLGTFQFAIDDAYKEELQLLFQTKKENGRKKEYTISLNQQLPPQIRYDEKKAVLTADTLVAKQYVDRTIDQQGQEAEFEVGENTIRLEGVELTDYRLTPERQKMMDLHGEPDLVIEDKELHQEIKKWSHGLFSVLQFSYPDDIMIRQVGRLEKRFQLATAIGSDFSFIIIDGIPVQIEDYSIIGLLPTEEIMSVEIINNPNYPRKYVSEVFGTPLALNSSVRVSFINIYTYSKKGLFGVRRTRGMNKKIIQGFSPLKEFYTPKYDNLEPSDWSIPDMRHIVYWNPSVIPDDLGKATVEYYNGDDIGDMLVVLETISKEGKIGYGQFSYKVTENLEK